MNTCWLRSKEKYIVEMFVKAVIMEIIPGQENYIKIIKVMVIPTLA